MSNAIHGMPVGECQKLVAKVAWRYKVGYSFTRDDLIQTGWESLLKAAESYDSSRGAKFSSYAWTRMVGDVRDFVRRFHKSGRSVSGREAVLAWNRGQGESQADVRLDLGVADEEGRSLHETIPDEGDTPEAVACRVSDIELVRSFGDTLRGNDAVVFNNMIMEDRKTGPALGVQLGVTKQRVAQIEKKIRKQLRAYIETNS